MGVREMDPTNMGYGPDHAHVPFEVTMALLATATAPAAASSAANVELFSASKMTRTKIDLWQATQGRMICMPFTLGNASTAAIKLSFMATEAATWSGIDTGVSVVLGNGTAATLHDSGWQNLDARCRVNDVTIAALVSVAFGTTAPTISSLYVLFR